MRILLPFGGYGVVVCHLVVIPPCTVLQRVTHRRLLHIIQILQKRELMPNRKSLKKKKYFSAAAGRQNSKAE
jgi:hypothetical protein